MSNTRLLSSLRPLIYVSKIFGVFPFNLKTDNNKIQVTVSKFGIIYGLCLATIREFYFISFYINYNFKNVFLGTMKIRRFVQIILTVLSVWFYLIHSKTLKTVIEECFNYSDRIRKKNFHLKIILVTTVELFLFFTLKILYDIPKHYLENWELDFGFLIVFFLRRASRMVTTIINVQFSNVLLYVSLLFKSVNEEVRSLTPSNSFGDNADGQDKVIDLIDIYSRLSTLCEKINKCFGFPMLALAIITTIVSVTKLFAAWTSKQEEFRIVNSLICLYNLVELWFILYSCNVVVSEAKKTCILVNDLMIQVKDSRLKEQLQQFSFQLLHRKVQFTACGLFYLDYTLLYTIAGAITAYLIIVIQFEGQSESDKEIKHQLNITRELLQNHLNRSLA